MNTPNYIVEEHGPYTQTEVDRAYQQGRQSGIGEGSLYGAIATLVIVIAVLGSAVFYSV